MAQQVIMGAAMACSFGASPATLAVLPDNRVNVNNMPAANIMDHIPTTNIPPFGMCNTITNPQVASATAAAQGVLTPQPCVPVTSTPWAPGAITVMVAGQPALDNMSKCACMWGGVISITSAGQTTVNVP